MNYGKKFVFYAIVVFALFACDDNGYVPLQGGPILFRYPTVGSGQVTLEWDAVDGAIEYNIYYLEGDYIDKQSGIKATTTGLTYTITGLTNHIEYIFAISAITSNGETMLGNTISATPTEVWQYLFTTDYETRNICSAKGPNGEIYFSFMDIRDCSTHVYKYQNDLFQELESPGSCARDDLLNRYSSMGVDSNGILYYVYTDTNLSYYEVLKKYENGTWSIVGGVPFAYYSFLNPAIAIDSNDNIYISCESNGGRIFKYDGASFTSIGSLETLPHDIIIDSKDKLYYYSQPTDDTYPLVCVYDGSNWMHVGALDIADVDHVNDIYVDRNDVLYLSYSTMEYDYIIKYQDGAWTSVGDLNDVREYQEADAIGEMPDGTLMVSSIINTCIYKNNAWTNFDMQSNNVWTHAYDIYNANGLMYMVGHSSISEINEMPTSFIASFCVFK